MSPGVGKVEKVLDSRGNVIKDEYLYRGFKITRHDANRQFGDFWKASAEINGERINFNAAARFKLIAKLDFYLDGK